MAILEIPEGKRARNRIRKDCAMNPQRNPTPPSLAAPLADLYSGLQATDKGLTSAEVKRRLAAYGANDPRLRAPSPLAQELTAFVSNPLVIILVLAAVISGFLGDIPDAVIIIVVVSLSSILNFIQSYRSHKAVEELRNSLVSTATAQRDGKWQEINRPDLVPGDVIQLQAGNLVPADCRLLEANDLHVQEAALTGESLPVDKRADLGLLPSEGPSENEACVFLGTSVVSGVGTALIVRTGRDTVFGDIAMRLAKRPPETEFEHGLRRFGVLILKTVVFLVLFVFLTSIVVHRDPLQSLLFSVALAVGLTPEFLPMITTITLSRGAVHMAKRGVIVKNLASIQNFGSMDVFCSDKTGTLTSGQMTLDRSIDPFGDASDDPKRFGILNSRLQTGIASPLDGAILAASGPAVDKVEKLGEAPFDFDRRRMSVVASIEDRPLLICKGAPEGVLAACTQAAGAELTDDLRAQCVATYESLSADGFRVLAVATKWVETKADYSAQDESDLNLIGYLTFVDPPLTDALDAIEQMKRAGVAIKIISGDNQLVTNHICKTVGLDHGKIVTGDDIAAMTDSALQHVAERTVVFARISPGQKSRIILALKARGHVVGYMGDGINDAPSLHAADVGISVSGAVDVAKDAAEIILVRPGLDVLHDGILEGRRAFGNVMKYLLMGTSSNFGNMFSMAGAAMFLPFLPMLPTQILLNNFLYDLSQVTIPTDEVDPSFIAKPRRWDIRLIRDFMIFIGPLSSIFDILTFIVLLRWFHAGEREFHTGWFVESLATQVLVILIIRTAGPAWRSRPSRPLLLTVTAIVALAALLPITPAAEFLGFQPLPVGYFFFLSSAVVVYLALVEVVKRMVFAKRGWSRT